MTRHGASLYFVLDIQQGGAIFPLKIYLNFNDCASFEMTGIRKFFFE
jgi:hypothetical protein